MEIFHVVGMWMCRLAIANFIRRQCSWSSPIFIGNDPRCKIAAESDIKRTYLHQIVESQQAGITERWEVQRGKKISGGKTHQTNELRVTHNLLLLIPLFSIAASKTNRHPYSLIADWIRAYAIYTPQLSVCVHQVETTNCFPPFFCGLFALRCLRRGSGYGSSAPCWATGEGGRRCLTI